MKPGRITVLLVAATTALGLAGLAVSGAALAQDDSDQTIEAKALDDHECVDGEWHFVITQIEDDQDTPDTIHVTWANGDDAVVHLDRITGKTAHYTTSLNLDSSVTEATAQIDDDWDGQFNLSHGPCDGEVPPQETPCPRVTATAEEGPNNHLEWTDVDDADSYKIYRGVGDADMELLATVDGDTLEFDDSDVEQGETYRYTVNAVVDGQESDGCNVVEVTAIPVFPTAIAAASAAVLGIGAYAVIKRRS